MTLSELLPALQSLPRREKFFLLQELISELAQEESSAREYPIWSPYDAHDAAATLLKLLEKDQGSQT